MANDFSADVNCKAVWKCDNDATDSKGNNDLTSVNTPTYSSTAGEFKEGTHSAVLDEASSQFFKITDAGLDSGFPFKSGESNYLMSIAMWVYIAEPSAAYRGLVGKNNYNGANVAAGAIMLGDVPHLTLSTLDFNVNLHLLNNAWSHLGLTWNGNTGAVTARLWDATNGIRTYSDSGTMGSLTLTGDWRVGAFSDENVSYTWTGKVDEIAVFSRILSAAEIDAIRGGTFSFTPAASTGAFLYFF